MSHDIQIHYLEYCSVNAYRQASLLSPLHYKSFKNMNQHLVLLKTIQRISISLRASVKVLPVEVSLNRLPPHRDMITSASLFILHWASTTLPSCPPPGDVCSCLRILHMLCLSLKHFQCLSSTYLHGLFPFFICSKGLLMSFPCQSLN